MKVVGHEYIINDLAGPLLQLPPQDFEKFKAAAFFFESWNSVTHIASDIMQCPWKVEVGVFWLGEYR